MNLPAETLSRGSSMVRMSSRRVACVVMQQARYSVEKGTWSMPQALDRHQHGCLTCQADAARHRLVMRGLTEMSGVTEPSPTDLSAPFEAGPIVAGTVPEWEERRRRTKAAIASASVAAIGIAVVAGRRLRSAS